MDQKIVSQLAKIVGEEYVSTRKDVLLTYSTSASIGYDSVLPGAVVRPRTTQEVSEIIKLANKHKIVVIPRSGGSSLQGEVIPKKDGLVVELMRLDDIRIFESLNSVKIGAGVTFGMLDKYLNKFDKWVPIYPESALVCTVAGNVVVNGSGPGSSVYGCIAEMVLGLEVVLPNGEIIQTGTEANPNAPGPFLRYAFGPDLTGLFIGSLGTFGIITSVSVKIFKRMHFFNYETYGFETAKQAEDFLDLLKRNDVNSVFASIYEGRILEFFLDMLGEEYGIPPTQWSPFTVSATIGRVREDQMKSDAAKAEELCKSIGGQVIGVKQLPQGEWDDRMRTFARSSYAHGWHWRILYHHQTPSNWHKSVDAIWDVMDDFGLLGHTAGFLSGHTSYNMYPHLYYDPTDKEEEMKVRDAHKELAKRLFKTGAVPFKLAPYWVDGVEEMKSYMDFIRSLKNSIDPNGIMNPKTLGGI
ncbi:MAG: FAD-binding oxidoreductase [Candidatus Thorarchaeota archaeon]